MPAARPRSAGELERQAEETRKADEARRNAEQKARLRVRGRKPARPPVDEFDEFDEFDQNGDVSDSPNEALISRLLAYGSSEHAQKPDAPDSGAADDDG